MPSAVLDALRVPVVQAPLWGGPSTPELTIAAGRAGAFDREAPRGYPQVHALTAPMRAAARARCEPDLIDPWAGQGHGLVARSVSAREMIARMADEIRAALDGARRRL